MWVEEGERERGSEGNGGQRIAEREVGCERVRHGEGGRYEGETNRRKNESVKKQREKKRKKVGEME